jgi:hypothetical protein
MTSATTYSTTDIIAQFPVAVEDMPTISSATEKPTFATLTAFQNALNTNALSVPSSKGGGQLGHLALVLKPEDYSTVSNNIAFDPPTDPGTTCTQPDGATAAQIAENIRVFNITRSEYAVFINVRQALQKLILAKVHPTYIEALRHPITQFAQLHPITILNHLWTTYGKITSQDLTANWTRMNETWNPPTPIENLYSQLTKGQAYALKGNEHLSDSQIQRIAYDLILQTGQFNDYCKDWRNKPEIAKTWTNFQHFFTIADEDRRKHTPTTSAAGYTANSIQEQVQTELINLLSTNDYTDSNNDSAPPTTETANAVTLEAVKTMMVEILQSNNNTGNRTRPTRPPPRLPAQGVDEDGTPVSYCWSHGITSNLAHTSCTCNRKKEGHKDDATLNNKMGGSTVRLRPRTTPPATST